MTPQEIAKRQFDTKVKLLDLLYAPTPLSLHNLVTVFFAYDVNLEDVTMFEQQVAEYVIAEAEIKELLHFCIMRYNNLQPSLLFDHTTTYLYMLNSKMRQNDGDLSSLHKWQRELLTYILHRSVVECDLRKVRLREEQILMFHDFAEMLEVQDSQRYVERVVIRGELLVMQDYAYHTINQMSLYTRPMYLDVIKSLSKQLEIARSIELVHDNVRKYCNYILHVLVRLSSDVHPGFYSNVLQELAHSMHLVEIYKIFFPPQQLELIFDRAVASAPRACKEHPVNAAILVANLFYCEFARYIDYAQKAFNSMVRVECISLVLRTALREADTLDAERLQMIYDWLKQHLASYCCDNKHIATEQDFKPVEQHMYEILDEMHSRYNDLLTNEAWSPLELVLHLTTQHTLFSPELLTVLDLWLQLQGYSDLKNYMPDEHRAVLNFAKWQQTVADRPMMMFFYKCKVKQNDLLHAYRDYCVVNNTLAQGSLSNDAEMAVGGYSDGWSCDDKSYWLQEITIEDCGDLLETVNLWLNKQVMWDDLSFANKIKLQEITFKQGYLLYDWQRAALFNAMRALVGAQVDDIANSILSALQVNNAMLAGKAITL